MELFNLSGKVAMVTGGCQNFGMEMATALGEVGADLVVTSRNLEKARNTAADYEKALGVRALGIGMDLLEEDSVVQAFDAVKKEYGKLHRIPLSSGCPG